MLIHTISHAQRLKRTSRTLVATRCCIYNYTISSFYGRGPNVMVCSVYLAM